MCEVPYKYGIKHGVEKYYDADKANIVCLTLYNDGEKVTSVEFGTKGGQSWLKIIP